MGPFLAASCGETTEWCDSGIEWWRRPEEEGGGGGEQRTRKQERALRGGRRKERVKEEGADGRF